MRASLSQRQLSLSKQYEGAIIIAKLYFRYGTMDSSKSARLIMDAHEYTQRGEMVFPVKPVVDTRSKKGVIESRVGISVKCFDLEKDYNIFHHVHNLVVTQGIKLSCVFVDEAQFLTYSHVLQLRLIADNLDIPVMCYGLKTDFTGHLFAGSTALFELANRFEEVKTMCRVDGCRHKAMFNVRYKNGVPIFKGTVVKVGNIKEEENKEYYVVKCSKHFLSDYAQYSNKGIKK